MRWMFLVGWKAERCCSNQNYIMSIGILSICARDSCINHFSSFLTLIRTLPNQLWSAHVSFWSTVLVLRFTPIPKFLSVLASTSVLFLLISNMQQHPHSAVLGLNSSVGDSFSPRIPFIDIPRKFCTHPFLLYVLPGLLFRLFSCFTYCLGCCLGCLAALCIAWAAV